MRSALLCVVTIGALSIIATPHSGSAADRSAEIATPHGNVRVEIVAADTVRVLKWPRAGSPEKHSLVVLPQKDADVAVETSESGSAVVMQSPRLRVSIDKKDGHVSFATAGGAPILAEAGPAAFEPFVSEYEKALSMRQGFALTPEEGVYGLGQHQDGFMDYRGHKVTLVQTNTDAVTPMLVSTGGWGILWDNTSKTIFEDSAQGTSLWSEVGDNEDYYFFYGPSIDGVIHGYRQLTGQAPLYGKWAYGYWQSKEHYHTQAEILGVAEEYRRRQIPIDTIIQDWNYWGTNEHWSGMTFDKERYPHPDEMVQRIHDLNLHMMISIWPGLGIKTAINKDMAAHGFLYAPMGWAPFKYYDAFNPAANDLYWKYLKEGLCSKGIDAFWIDSTEPDVINALSKVSSAYELERMGRNHLGSWARTLNAYSLVMMDALHDHLRQENDRRRVSMLTRSAFAGQQRTGATTWSGDIGASWDIYHRQIPAGLNFSMAGLPYWTFDIGGFVISAYGGVFTHGGNDPAYQELYTRMFQFGAFCPIFRSHGSETPREIWHFGDFTPVLVKFDRLRYRLLPYIYSQAWQVTHAGSTIMRGLPMDFPKDRATYKIDDQFMFGPALMVAPVTEYMLHRPPEPSVLVTSDHFRTPDGKVGLEASYYRDTEYKQLSLTRVDPQIDVDWYGGRPDYATDSTFAIRWKGKLVPDETGPFQFHIKCFGPKRIILDGRQLPYVSQSTEVYTEIVNLEAGHAYDFVLETENFTPGAARVFLNWKTPSIFAREKQVEERKQTRSVYLPAGSRWVDFWTGEKHEGGATLESPAPIDMIPMFVRAGSIVPMGPVVQYANEKPNAPIELRIYPGADGSFVLYDDAGDSYDYESGKYATTRFAWDDAQQKLTIEARQGTFPGMAGTRLFRVVVVRPGRGTGGDETPAADREVTYDGKRQVLALALAR